MRFVPFACAVALSGGVSSDAAVPVRVSAAQSDTAEAPVSLVVSEKEWRKRRPAIQSGLSRTCQVETLDGGQLRVTFLAPALKKGESRVVQLSANAKNVVEVKQAGKNAEIFVNGALFTRYDTTTGPNKPYLYPIQAFGKSLTRKWPLDESDPTEAKDHPHHRGLWVTHGELNDIDFWTESSKDPKHLIGKSVNAGYGKFVGGAVQGRLETKTDWNAPDGKTIAKDTRMLLVTPLTDSGGILLDFSVTVTPVGGPLRWGDTKEGTFALRVPESMKADKPGIGKLINAEGLTDAALWGKPSPWNDYSGNVGGETLGMAIFDSPQNPRYPTTWHSRTYGLFAANPFGLHDFDPTKKTDRHAGDLVTPLGESVTFRYRIYFHRGNASTANVAGSYAAWATPPVVALEG